MLLLLSNWRATAVAFQHLQDCAILQRGTGLTGIADALLQVNFVVMNKVGGMLQRVDYVRKVCIPAIYLPCTVRLPVAAVFLRQCCS